MQLGHLVMKEVITIVETTLPALQVLPAGNSMTNIHDGSLYPCDIPSKQ